MSNANEMMRQAQRMQRKLQQINEQMKTREWTAKVADDKVSATVTGERKVTSIVVDDAFWKGEEREIVLDSIAAAVNAAQERADKDMETAMSAATNGLKIPGINM